jgi:hypothetical protein|tara:strand:- start:260989 stop:261795 length:807 start_codon:yes stop_codon:yes gene_type:complete
MKTLYIKLVLFFFSMSIASYAQISVFDIVEDAKKERGDATDAAEVEADAKAMEGMQQFFSETTGMKDTGDKPMAGRCLDVMGDHAYKLAELQDQIEKTKDCKKKKELLEYQALLILSGGTKFFCPDEFNSDHTKYGKEISEYFKPLTELFVGFQLDSIPEDVIFNEEERKKFNDRMDEILESNTKEELQELVKTLLKFRYADEKLENPYAANLPGKRLMIIFYRQDLYFTDEEHWTMFMNYFTYFLSPQFMAKRSKEINSMIQSLPCN